MGDIIEYLKQTKMVLITQDAFDELKKRASVQSEIIRCKDCRHWCEHGLCGKWDHYISNGDFYCGCAERKEGEI